MALLYDIQNRPLYFFFLQKGAPSSNCEVNSQKIKLSFLQAKSIPYFLRLVRNTVLETVKLVKKVGCLNGRTEASTSICSEYCIISFFPHPAEKKQFDENSSTKKQHEAAFPFKWFSKRSGDHCVGIVFWLISLFYHPSTGPRTFFDIPDTRSLLTNVHRHTGTSNFPQQSV